MAGIRQSIPQGREILTAFNIREMLLDNLRDRNNEAFGRWMRSGGGDPEPYYRGAIPEVIVRYRDEYSNNKVGSITRNRYAGEKQYIVTTANSIRAYKTLAGAKRYLQKEGYEDSNEENNA